MAHSQHTGSDCDASYILNQGWAPHPSSSVELDPRGEVFALLVEVPGEKFPNTTACGLGKYSFYQIINSCPSLMSQVKCHLLIEVYFEPHFMNVLPSSALESLFPPKPLVLLVEKGIWMCSVLKVCHYIYCNLIQYLLLPSPFFIFHIGSGFPQQ